MLTDFRHTVRSYTSICDQEIYIKQFNVFFWLFQQQAVGQDVQNELNAFKAQLTQQTLEKSPQKSLINGSSLFRTPQVANGNNSLFQTPQVIVKHVIYKVKYLRPFFIESFQNQWINMLIRNN